MDLKTKEAIAQFVALRDRTPCIIQVLRHLEDAADQLSSTQLPESHQALLQLGRINGIRENCRKLRTMQPPTDDEPEEPFTTHIEHPDLVNGPIRRK